MWMKEADVGNEATPGEVQRRTIFLKSQPSVEINLSELKISDNEQTQNLISAFFIKDSKLRWVMGTDF